MTVHSLYPGFVKLFYTGNGHTHVQTLPVKPSASGSSWSVAKILGGDYDPWTDAIDAWTLLMKDCLASGDGITSADLYTMDSVDADPLYRETYSVGVAGTVGTAATPFLQVVVPHRTSLGGLWRLMLMETAVGAANVVDRPPIAANAINTLSGMAISSDGFVWGRDGGYPITRTGLITKYNDALRKKYLLAT